MVVSAKRFKGTLLSPPGPGDGRWSKWHAVLIYAGEGREKKKKKKKKKNKKAEEKISYEIRTWKRKCNGFTRAWTPAQKLSKINLNLYVWHICELFARGR